MLNFSRFPIINALAKLFQLKGQPHFQLDQTLLPVVLSADATAGPYQRDLATQVAARTSRAAVAASHGHWWVKPGPAVILEVQQLRISNTTAGAVAYRVAYLTAAAQASIGADESAFVRNLNTEDLVNDGARSSKVEAGVDGQDQTFGDLDLVGLPSGEDAIIEFPNGVFLYGGSAPYALAVVSLTQNAAIEVSFKGREWPLI